MNFCVRNSVAIPVNIQLAHLEQAKTLSLMYSPLTPRGHTALGRTSFQIHGDSINAPGEASSGCIIMPRMVRERIWRSNDRLLKVVK